MINVAEAQKIIQDTTPVAQTEELSIVESNGRILAKDLIATRNQPPFDRVTMDGIAIDSTSGITEYTIEGIQAAGQSQLTLSDSSMCFEVMTGASLPIGCDCVIPYELIQINTETKKVIINKEDIVAMNNIHKESSDYKEGDILLEAGLKITSPVCAIITSQGRSKVTVYKNPKVVIISTGSELVDLDQTILPYQIFMSNSYAIEAELKNYGLSHIKRMHIPDDEKETEIQIEKVLNEYEIVILTGGVSRGKFDYIPGTLEKLGVSKLFHKIKQKPGKPMWYGTKGTKQVFALPGNPVSCLVCLRRYVIPSLDLALNQVVTPVYGELQKKIEFKNDFTFYIPVKTSHTKDGKLALTPISNNGSGDFYATGLSDGFAELPSDQEIFNTGESFRYYSWS
jgi:molybdopterin molybdotransferase